MNWGVIGAAVLFGGAAGFTSAATVILTLDAWPSELQWLKIVVGFCATALTTMAAYVIHPGDISDYLKAKGVLK